MTNEPPSRTDFYRPVYCILGIPVDAMSMSDLIRSIDTAVSERRRCFLSTPNLNFCITALKNPDFRDSLLISDLSSPDGMPLVFQGLI